MSKPKVWKLWRNEDIGYDEYDSIIVVAFTEDEARRLANIDPGDEGFIWNDPARVFCSEIDYEHEYVLLGSFNSG